MTEERLPERQLPDGAAYTTGTETPYTFIRLPPSNEDKRDKYRL